MPIGALDGTVLVRDALVVARRRHAVVLTQGIKAVGKVGPGLPCPGS
jgi:hypothetical protein